MAKKSDYSLFINFFFNSLKKIGLVIIFLDLIIHYSLFFAHYSLFINKKGRYSLIIIPHPGSHLLDYSLITLTDHKSMILM